MRHHRLATLAQAQARTLEDHSRLILECRARGEDTRELVMAVLLGATRAVAREHEAQRLALKFLADEIVYDGELDAYAVSADVDRYGLGEPPPQLTLLDNGVYAPELTGQIGRPLTPATAVYNLGALLYYSVTGLEPVAGFSRLADALPSVRIFEPQLPPGIDTALRRAVARRPEDRFPDPSVFFSAMKEAAQLDVRRRETATEHALLYHYAAATHPGINKGHKNPQNQDRFFAAYDAEMSLGLFVVADGVSTCTLGTGDRAAVMVIEAAQSFWSKVRAAARSNRGSRQEGADHHIASLRALFEEANDKVVRELIREHGDAVNSDSHVMSSTAVVALIEGRRLTIGNLGDSRVYLIRDDLIDQLTVDMDRKTQLLRQGKGLDAVMNASGLGQLTGNVGRVALTDAGVEAAQVHPEFTSLDLLAGDRLLICSDGVPDCIGAAAHEQIYKTVLDSHKPAQVTWGLIVAANDGGGDDNITAIVVACANKEEDPPWATTSS